MIPKRHWVAVDANRHETEEQRDGTPDVVLSRAPGGPWMAKLRTARKLFGPFESAGDGKRYFDRGAT